MTTLHLSTSHRLANFLADVAANPMAFDWGGNHCGHFVARWWALKTGHTPELPAAHDLRSARRAVLAAGGLQAAASAALQREAMLPTLARAGDVLLFEVAAQDSGVGGLFGISDGMHAVVPLQEGGFAFLATLQAVAAWPLEVRA